MFCPPLYGDYNYLLQLTKIVNGFDNFYNSKLHLVMIPRCMRASRMVIGEKLSYFLPRYTSQAADTRMGEVHTKFY